MAIKYPQFFEETLRRDLKLRAGVDKLVHRFEEWLSVSRLPFFVDYTDHGITHLDCVLATAEGLISEDSRRHISEGDVATLVAAVLLHDSAMHLSESGFHFLIHGPGANWCIDGFSDKKWSRLWDEYLFSAKRWDERKLCSVLGENKDGSAIAKVRDPFDSYENMTSADKKLIGEFIRIHHPRMAHEFGVYGVPGANLTKLDDTLSLDLRNLAGLIARSHGLALRSCLHILDKNFHKREYQGIHAVFLMALLRIADYIQIQPGRAPASAFRYRHIPSKLSKFEWETHQSVVNITQAHDDPESIEIQARPRNVRTFLRLKDWLAGIQNELDASWAVLGEVYGSHQKLRDLGLVLRRVYSNLDDIESFSKTVDYVPERIVLSVARADLLKLLVGPLYDNIPSIGARELMQNAIDVVREREALQDLHPDLKNIKLIEQKHDIELQLTGPDEKGVAWFEISDRGTGMNIEIARNYFLTAGASFRNSDAWKREFGPAGKLKAKMPDTKKLLRSGRFGVGVLAGFLLGRTMEVSTRHIRDKAGLKFQVSLESEVIELKRVENLQIGTKIRIPISEQTFESLQQYKRVSVPTQMDWFIYDKPSIGRTKRESVDGQTFFETPLPTEFMISDPNAAESNFRKLTGERPYSVFWTYSMIPNLSVNGIRITSSKIRGDSVLLCSEQIAVGKPGFFQSYKVSQPSICVEDPNAQFPLNLRRSDISESSYPFKGGLLRDVVDDFIASLLTATPEKIETWPRSIHKGLVFEKSVTVDSGPLSAEIDFLALSSEGITLLSNSSLRGKTSILLSLGQCKVNSNCVGNNSIILRGSALSLTGIWALQWSPREFKIPRLDEMRGAATFKHNTDREFPLFADLYPLAALNLVFSKGLRDWLGTKDLKFRIVAPARIAEMLESQEWLRTFEEKVDSSISENSLRARSLLQTVEHVKDLFKSLETVDVKKTPEDSDGGVTEITLSESEVQLTRVERLALKPIGDSCVVELMIDQPLEVSDDSLDSNPLSERWTELFGSGAIPLDLAERKRKLAHVYRELDYFVDRNERDCGP